MNKDTLRDAVIEAERFIKAANQVKWDEVKRINIGDIPFEYTKFNSTTTAAAKRASLDLTRALAKMRKPG